MREGSSALDLAPTADSCGGILTAVFLTKRLAATAAMAIQDNAKATMLRVSLLPLSPDIALFWLDDIRLVLSDM